VPLKAGPVDFGSLILFGEAFSDDDRMTAASLASQAVVALDNARLHRIVAKQARIDGLTGLANRRQFEQQLAVELAPANPQAALARARSILAGSAGKLGPIQLTPQLVGGKLVISDSPAAAAALRGRAKLVDDAAFKDAVKAAGAPQRTSALVYADMPQLAPFLQLAAPALGGQALDPTLVDTLGHVGPVVAWATRSGGTSRFELWARRR
jgi:hypothetical protein